MTGERKQEILQIAIEIIADEGYSSLTMRSLARASGMKLGALQYHFRTWDELLRSLVGVIESEIKAEWSSQGLDNGATVYAITSFMLAGIDEPGDIQLGDKLWPQLWAMEEVEPLVADLLQEVYAEYLLFLEGAMERAGIESPRGEALCLMSMLEGESLFTGQGRRWEKDRALVRDTILEFVEKRYGAT
ncbi:MAG: TetR/AcrR family transcriptional regulator [Gammaproteobacteria bacterium]|jgi:AcrR family transcriptional regulator